MPFGEHEEKPDAMLSETKHHDAVILRDAQDDNGKAEPKSHKVHVKHVTAHGEKPKMNIDEGLRAVYQDETGVMPDMTKLEHRQSRGWLFALVMIVALGLALGAAWVGYLVFSPYILHTDVKLAVHIDAPETVVSLDTTSLTLTYENTGREPMGGGEIHLNIPQEFHMTSSEPLHGTDPATWALESLAPGASGTITLTGYFTAQSGSNAFFQSVARYSPAGNRTQYEDISSKTVLISGSKLDVSLDAPAESIAGEKSTFTFHVKNTSDRRMEHISFRTKMPDSFLVSGSIPKTETDGSVNIGTLDANQEVKIIVAGTFSANHADSETISGSIFLAQDTLAVLQGEAVSPVRVISSDLELRALANGSANDQNIDFGGRLRLSLIYKNNANRPMKDVSVSVTVDAAPDALIDWKKFDEETKEDKTFMRKGETLIVNMKLNKTFEEIASETEGTLSYSVPLVSSAVADAKGYKISITSHAAVAMIGKTKTTKSVDTTPFVVTPNTDLVFSGGASYFDEDGTPIGSGPLPPQVDAETKYRVHWAMTNSVHDVKDVTIKTQLAEGVAWVGNTLAEGGALSYDESTRTVSWKLERVLATTPSVAVDFDIALTPKASQLDSFAPLTTGATLTATDAFTGAILTRSGAADTTELPSDPGAKDKGLVVPAPKKTP